MKKLVAVSSLKVIFTPYLVAIILFQLPIAFMIDEYGPTIVIGSFMLISTIGILMLGLSYSALILWTALFITGIGVTVTYANVFKLISNWFRPAYFPIMVGATICIAHIGAAFGQPLVEFFLANFAWAKIFTNYGILGIIYALFFFFIFRASSSSASYNIFANHQTSFIKEAILTALKNRENWLIAICFGLFEGHRIVFDGFWHIASFEALHETSHQATSLLNAPTMLAYGFGALFFGWLAMRKKVRKKLIIMGAIIAICANLTFIYFPTLPIPFILSLFYVNSFFAGTFFLTATLIHEKNSPQVTATVIGMLIVSLSFFRLITDWLIRAIIYFTGINLDASAYSSNHIKWIFLIFPLSALIGLILFLRVKETYGKQKI